MTTMTGKMTVMIVVLANLSEVGLASVTHQQLVSYEYYFAVHQIKILRSLEDIPKS